MNKKLTLQELELLNTASAYNGEQHKAICGKAALELIEYKKIEDDLGIDFITLFETKTVWCKTLVENMQTKEQSYQIIERNLWGINLEYKEIMVGSPYSFGSHKIQDYGKTWALTKEELE